MKTIPLNQGFAAIVDDIDFERLSQHKWQVSPLQPTRKHIRYAGRIVQRNLKRRGVYMHREIIGAKKGEVVDHINHDGLDNRRCNLRIATPSQNGLNRAGLQPNNTSGVTGVTWNRMVKKWQAQIMVNQRTMYLGSFVNLHDAVEARNKAFNAMP